MVLLIQLQSLIHNIIIHACSTLLLEHVKATLPQLQREQNPTDSPLAYIKVYFTFLARLPVRDILPVHEVIAPIHLIAAHSCCVATHACVYFSCIGTCIYMICNI